MRLYDEVRLDCRCCGVDLLKGEWQKGCCRRCDISIDRLIKTSIVHEGHAEWMSAPSRIDV